MNTLVQITGAAAEVKDELSKALEEMETAAWDLGVSPVEPMGVFLKTQRVVLESLTGLLMVQQQTVAATIDNAKVLARTEVERLQTTVASADLAIRQAQSAGIAADIEKSRVVERMVNTIAPDLVAALRKPLILKEIRHNKRLNVLHWMKAGALVSAVFLAGYSVRSWETWDATSAIERCRTNILVNRDGRSYCAVDHLFGAPAAAPQAAR